MIDAWKLLVHGLDRSVLQLVVWLAIAMLTMVPLERLRPLRPRRGRRAGTLHDLLYFFLSGLVPAFLLVVVYAVVIQGFRALLPAGWFAWVQGLPGAVKLVATVVVGDFGFYWAHRWAHEWPALWRVHAIHHSPEQLDWLVATRTHPLEIAWLRGLSFVPVFAAGLIDPGSGVHSTAVMLVVLFNVYWGFFIHANTRIRLKWLEPILSTPRFHHWHHANDGVATHGKNYAALLPCLDRLFGTHLLPADAYPRHYGSTTPVPAGFRAQLTLRRAGGAADGPSAPGAALPHAPGTVLPPDTSASSADAGALTAT